MPKFNEKLTNIDTEKRNINTMNIDTLNSLEILNCINMEDSLVHQKINNKLKEISYVVDHFVTTLKSEQGRVFYLGAGTSGRIALIDAVELLPTYNVNDDQVIALIAGGEQAFIKAQEGAEDSKELAINDLKKHNLNENDYVIGLAASGRTPYVIGGIEYAKTFGCKTACITAVNESKISEIVDHAIDINVGPEVVTGSTRMKAGTMQKMVINMISTASMTRYGKVYQNLMVDVIQTNLKLEERAKQIIIQATNCDYELASKTLQDSKGNVKIAITAILLNIDPDIAKEKLLQVDGYLRKLI